jgi:translation elongation factor EF-1alpha
MKKTITKKQKLVGKITHYFSKIKVAVVKISSPIEVGDEVRITGGEDTDFKQPIKSMQQEHEKILKASKGKEIGLKVKDKVREGYKVFKI